MNFIDLGAQRSRIQTEIDEAIQKVLHHGRYINGPEVSTLEEKLAAFSGAKFCISCANGTDALQVALMAYDIGPGDEVIVPSFSYIATAEAAALLGATPIYVDVCPKSYLIDVDNIKQAISRKTKAIIPVSLFGQCPNFKEINAIAAKNGIPVIEDAAQSFGATYNGTRSANLSNIACTSFFPSKPLGCYGDGGAIFTSDETLASKLRQIARHGQKERYLHVRVGINSRLDTIQAAILLEKLKVLESEISARQNVADQYQSYLSDLPEIMLPQVVDGNTSVWAQYTISTHARDHLKAELNAAGIPTAIHYPLALHQQPAVSAPIKLEKSEHAAKSVISLPMHPYLKPQQIEFVASKVKDALTTLG